MRRTDFLPVGGEADDKVSERGYESLSDDDEGRGIEYACEGNESVFDGMVDIEDLVSKKDDIDLQRVPFLCLYTAVAVLLTFIVTR